MSQYRVATIAASVRGPKIFPWLQILMYCQPHQTARYVLPTRLYFVNNEQYIVCLRYCSQALEKVWRSMVISALTLDWLDDDPNDGAVPRLD